MTTPVWQAPINGLPGALDATNATAGLNQLLGAHAQAEVYQGTQIVTPSGAQSFTWTAYGNGTDLSQPFTMSGTTVGRVEVPLQPNGNGADVLVSLYADNGSGSPNLAVGAICSTLLPAAYLNQVCAPSGLTAGGPLATARDNTGFLAGGVTSRNYAIASAGTGGISTEVSVASSGTYVVTVGGIDNNTNNCVPTVNVLSYAGAGVLAPPVPQPSLPIGMNGTGVAFASGSIVVASGITGSNTSPTYTTDVWVASWNSSTGAIGGWSAQAALPVAVQLAGTVGYGNFVYVTGGLNASGNATSVYYALVNNGQIASWSTGPPLPVALSQHMVAAVNGWLFVIGGATSGSSPLSGVYYAKINADGSLGSWQTGPSLPTPIFAFGPGFDTLVADDLIAIVCGFTTGGSSSAVQVLTVTPASVGDTWKRFTWNAAGFFPTFAFSNGDGTYGALALDLNSAQTHYTDFASVPYVSVPLPATGLSNGATYHVVLRQFSEMSASDYVAFGTLDGTPLPAAALTHGRYASGAWTSVGAGRSVPMSVFDQTTGGPVLHTWEDASTTDMAGTAARWTAFQYGAQSQLTGLCEMTLQPNVPLNSNPTFTSGVSPWTATNGTITQSSAQTHGGYAFSGLLTPTGGFSQAHATSELMPVTQTPWGDAQWVMPTGWFYSPTGWSSFSLSMNWYDSSKAYISTSSGTVALAANTWTQVSNHFQPPATAAYGALVPTQSGSPGASNLLYMSDVQLLLSPETVGALTSAATVNYGSTPLPTGITQLL